MSESEEQSQNEIAQSFLEGLPQENLDVPKLNEPQFLFANLLYKTDFSESEISDILEWTPTEDDLDQIYEVIDYWIESEISSRRNNQIQSTIIL